MRFRSVPGLLIAGVILLLALPSFATFYTDWLWFGEVGYQSVFLRRLNAQAIVFGITFVAVFIALVLNLRVARRTRNRADIGLVARGAAHADPSAHRPRHRRRRPHHRARGPAAGVAGHLDRGRTGRRDGALS